MTAHLTATGLLLAAKAAPIINWAGLLKVLALALLTGVIIVGGYSLGLAALDVYTWSLKRQPTPDEHGLLAVQGEGAPSKAVAAPTGGARYASLAVAVFFFGVCTVGVVIGLVEMFSK